MRLLPSLSFLLGLGILIPSTSAALTPGEESRAGGLPSAAPVADGTVMVFVVWGNSNACGSGTYPPSRLYPESPLPDQPPTPSEATAWEWSPAEIAALLRFLLSDEAGFLVGSVLFIDGGTEAALRGEDWPAPLG